jgi:cobalt-zinc-cadmium efflux system protein
LVKHSHGNKHSKAEAAETAFNISGVKIFWVVLLNAVITIAEFIGGLLSGSLALLSDAAHNLSDTSALALSYFANRIAQRPKDSQKTYGYKRAEILAAFINSSVLIAISLVLITEAVKRLRAPEMIDSNLMITVAVIGLLANLLSVILLEKDSRNNLNIKSSYLHLISDTVSSVGVITGGFIIKYFGIIWVDPVITFLISLYIIKKTWIVIRKTVDILMQSSAKLDYGKIKADIENISGVKNIHHVHSWLSDEKTIYFEAHIEMENMQLCDAEDIYTEIEQYLIRNHGINHVTLQAEVNKCCEKTLFKC